jgi:hypothetical protein
MDTMLSNHLKKYQIANKNAKIPDLIDGLKDFERLFWLAKSARE